MKRGEMEGQSGQITEKTIRTRVITEPEPETGGPPKNPMPEFWSTIERLTPDDWSRHIVYIYREEPKVSTYAGREGFAVIDKCPGYIEIRPGLRVPFTSAEEVQLAIREKFGGTAFRLLLKRGSSGERISEGKCINEAPPKMPPPTEAASGAAPPTDASAAASIGAKAIDALSGVESKGIGIAMQALDAAAKALNQPQQHSNPLLDKLLETAIARMLQPPADLLETLLKFKELKEVISPAPAPDTLRDKILETAVTRMLNSPATDRTTMGIELARQIPNVSTALKDSVHEWRLGVEAQERTAAIARGVRQAPAANRAEPVAEMPVRPAPESTVEVSMDPPLEWIEHKIVAIIGENLPGNETADEILAFLSRAYPAMISELLNAGQQMISAGVIPQSATPSEAGILHLFQTRPVLKQVPVNPRLVEIIKTFVAYAKQPAKNDQPTA